VSYRFAIDEMTLPAILAGPQAPRICLAEDDDDIRRFVAIILKNAGYPTEAYGNGRDALDAARQSAARLYLLDVRMPGMTGIELCRALRASPRTGNSRILLMSAEWSDEKVAAAFDAGADGYLPKPFSRRELLRRVHELITAAPDDQPGLSTTEESV
jgi:DNA-binding response OmpR family regulator